MAKEPDWLTEAAETVEADLDRLENLGGLTDLSDYDLLELARTIADTLKRAYDLCKEHERRFPSFVWFGISTLSGLGGIFLLEPTTASLLVTIGGVAGAAKSIFDRGLHLVREQRFLGLYWRADRLRNAIAAELIRRGVRF